MDQFPRGQIATFTVDFSEPDGTPIVPATPSVYPQFKIIAPDATVPLTGVGTPVPGQPSKWMATWNILADATLSPPGTSHRIEWYMVGPNARSATQSFDFLVVDSNYIPVDDQYNIFYVTYMNKSERVFYSLDVDPYDISAEVYDPSNILIQTAVKGAPTPPDIQLTRLVDGSNYVFYFDTDPLDVDTSQPVPKYRVVWTVQKYASSPREYIVKFIAVPDFYYWEISSSVRTIVDRLHKRHNKVQGITESLVYESIDMATRFVNGTIPTTTYYTRDLWTNRGGLGFYLVEAAAVHVLKTQHILEVELAFNFSGQTVTLDYDRTAGYDAAITRMMDDLTTKLPITKINEYRKVVPFVSVGVRPMYKDLRYTMVIPMETTTGGPSIASMLSKLGLL